MIEELKSVAVRKLIRALERDGFVYRRLKGSQRIYRHPDGRRVVIHYHHGGDTLPPVLSGNSSQRPTRILPPFVASV